MNSDPMLNSSAFILSCSTVDLRPGFDMENTEAAQRWSPAWLAKNLRGRFTLARSRRAFIRIVRNKRVLEIGGPSSLFGRNGTFPVYRYARSLDNCNFTDSTLWESGLRDGGTFEFDENKSAGTQYLREATDLSGMCDNCYDAILSSHTLEHLANPIRAIHEWRRVLRPGGTLAVIVPCRVTSFDRYRTVTTIEHLRSDFSHNTPEDDQTHVEEILQFHDLTRDPGAGSREAFIARARENARFRALHHHVFDEPLLGELLKEGGFNVTHLWTIFQTHHIAFGQKSRL